MRPAELGYVVVSATDVERWREFGTQMLGAMAVDGPGGSLWLRLDERSARIVVVPGERDEFAASGWLAQDEAAFAQARADLAAAGVDVVDGGADELGARQVIALLRFTDPAGNVHEVACGPVASAAPFVSPLGVRFATGADGVGHVVLPTRGRLAESVEFWTGVMSFSRANSRTFPNGALARFLSCNDRQHTLALAEVAPESRCVHIALEVATLDDCGRALDRAERLGLLTRRLGKHLNDNMVSFYLRSPGNFEIEYGFGDGPPAWRHDLYFEDAGGSHWGHAFVTPR